MSSVFEMIEIQCVLMLCDFDLRCKNQFESLKKEKEALAKEKDHAIKEKDLI